MTLKLLDSTYKSTALKVTINDACLVQREKKSGRCVSKKSEICRNRILWKEIEYFPFGNQAWICGLLSGNTCGWSHFSDLFSLFCQENQGSNPELSKKEDFETIPSLSIPFYIKNMEKRIELERRGKEPNQVWDII